MAERSECALGIDQMGKLIAALVRQGYEVIGPRLRDGAIVYDKVQSVEDLPAGWSDEQEAGRYRLKRREDDALFGYAVGPQSWKRYLHPAEMRLWSAERAGGTFRILNNEAKAQRPYALLGVRACELAAIAVQDRVLMEDKYHDPIYERRRAGAFVIAVQCTQAAATCFCASMGTGPRVSQGFDLVLTELLGSKVHRFLMSAGSDRGAAMLRELEVVAADAEDREKALALVQAAANQQVRKHRHRRDQRASIRKFRASALGQRGLPLPELCELHDGLPDMLLHFGGRRDGRDRGSRGTLAAVGFLLHAKLFVYPRRQRPNFCQSALSAVDDAQAGVLDRPVRQFGMRWAADDALRGARWELISPRRSGRFGKETSMETLERIIAEHPFFAGIDHGFTDLMVSCASNMRFKAGTYILKEGDSANTFYLVRDGRVAVEVVAPQRKPIIVSTLGVGRNCGVVLAAASVSVEIPCARGG